MKSPVLKLKEKTVIWEVHNHDVLNGRGVSCAQHPGNERFRLLILAHHDPEYCTSYSLSQKKALADEIVQNIEQLNPPGRFLKRPSAGKKSKKDAAAAGPWELMTREEAVKKARQALRDCNRQDREGYAHSVKDRGLLPRTQTAAKKKPKVKRVEINPSDDDVGSVSSLDTSESRLAPTPGNSFIQALTGSSLVGTSSPSTSKVTKITSASSAGGLAVSHSSTAIEKQGPMSHFAKAKLVSTKVLATISLPHKQVTKARMFPRSSVAGASPKPKRTIPTDTSTQVGNEAKKARHETKPASARHSSTSVAKKEARDGVDSPHTAGWLKYWENHFSLRAEVDLEIQNMENKVKQASCSESVSLVKEAVEIQKYHLPLLKKLCEMKDKFPSLEDLEEQLWAVQKQLDSTNGNVYKIKDRFSLLQQRDYLNKCWEEESKARCKLGLDTSPAESTLSLTLQSQQVGTEPEKQQAILF